MHPMSLGTGQCVPNLTSFSLVETGSSAEISKAHPPRRVGADQDSPELVPGRDICEWTPLWVGTAGFHRLCFLSGDSSGCCGNREGVRVTICPGWPIGPCVPWMLLCEEPQLCPQPGIPLPLWAMLSTPGPCPGTGQCTGFTLTSSLRST